MLGVSVFKHLNQIISSMLQFHLSSLLLLMPTFLFLLTPSIPFYTPPFCFLSRRLRWRQKWNGSLCNAHQYHIFRLRIFMTMFLNIQDISKCFINICLRLPCANQKSNGNRYLPKNVSFLTVLHLKQRTLTTCVQIQHESHEAYTPFVNME
jgi:hypothetical protein